MSTFMSGNAVMNPCAASVMVLRPAAGASSLMLSEPFDA